MRIRIFFTFFFLILVILISCHKEPPAESRKEMIFQVDSTLIADCRVLDDIGLSFHPPEGWALLTGDAMEAVREQTREDDPSVPFSVVPEIIFNDESSMSILSVSRIVMKDDIPGSKEFKNRYHDFIQRLEKSAHIQEDTFLMNGIPVTQYLIQDEFKVVFKFLLKNIGDNWVQFDYIVLRDTYSDEVKAIESSVGSIRRNDVKGGADD